MTYKSKYEADSENKDDIDVIYLVLCLHNHLSVSVSESKEYPCCISNRNLFINNLYLSRPKQANNIMIKDVLKSFCLSSTKKTKMLCKLLTISQPLRHFYPHWHDSESIQIRSFKFFYNFWSYWGGYSFPSSPHMQTMTHVTATPHLGIATTSLS